jgi:hypothetical protein
MLVRQYRYPIADELCGLPAGALAAREEAGRVIARGAGGLRGSRAGGGDGIRGRAPGAARRMVCSMPGGNDQRVYLFVATGLARRAQHLDGGG